MDLLHQICRCPNVQQWLMSPQENNPCATVISVQENSNHTRDVTRHQIPEPWSGDLKHAPVLFLSSNPSIDEEEVYPTWSWTDEKIDDFFTHRFSQGIENGTHNLRRDGSRVPVRFWIEVKQRAKELLERDVVGGTDYALTEVVHCKSRREIGVKEALSECARRYLRQVVTFSQARIIVVLGKTIKETVKREFSIPENIDMAGPALIGEYRRYIVFLPHPNARGYRSFRKCLGDEKLQELQAFLHSEMLETID